MSDNTAERWAVVGGGMLGMTLAHRLAGAGRDVTLLEAADHLGGLASAWALDDVVWDRHYHVTLLSDSYLRRLLGELGLERDLKWVQTRTGFYADGGLVSVSNAMEFLRFPLLGWPDKLRLALTIAYASRIRDWRKLESIPVGDWLIRWSGRRTFERMWLPLLRAKLGDSYRKTSAAFIWATIARLYAARRTGLKKEMFGYVPGGYARVLDRFAEVLAGEGVRISLRSATSGVERLADGRLAVTAADGRHDLFDRVVVTAAANVAARICRGITADEQTRLLGIEYQGIVCASLLLRRPLSSFYLTNIADPSIPFTGVVEMSALVDRQHFRGHALVYLPKYVSPDDPIFELSDGEVAARFLPALERMHSAFRRDDLLCFKVSRVRRVFALPTIGYSDRLPPIVTSVPGLYIVNSAHIVNGTLNVNETVQLAEAAASRFLRMAVPPAALPRAGQNDAEATGQPLARSRQ